MHAFDHNPRWQVLLFPHSHFIDEQTEWHRVVEQSQGGIHLHRKCVKSASVVLLVTVAGGSHSHVLHEDSGGTPHCPQGGTWRRVPLSLGEAAWCLRGPHRPGLCQQVTVLPQAVQTSVSTAGVMPVISQL